MREIKFRAWDKEKREMIYPKQFFSLDLESGEFASEMKEWKKREVMQFTGLKDKNGKEICEGDVVTGVVEFPQLLTIKNSKFKMAGSVFYDHSGFALEVIQKMCDPEREGMVNYFSFIGENGYTFEDVEIIGNIYENPSLLS